MSGRAQILAVVPNSDTAHEILAALTPLGWGIHICKSGQQVGEVLRGHPIDMVLYAGDLQGLSAERVVTALLERIPSAVFVFALRDIGMANMLAMRFRGHAVPWPINPAYLQALLDGVVETSFILARKEVRHRLLASCQVFVGSSVVPGLLINVSTGGLMAASDAIVNPGTEVAIVVSYGERTFKLNGRVVHAGDYPTMRETIEAADWLRLRSPIVFGLQLDESCQVDSTTLCSLVARDRELMQLRALALPAIPRALAAIFERFRVRIETHVPSEEPLAPVLVVDLATCSRSDLERLPILRGRTVLIALSTGELTDPLRLRAAATLPRVFSLPMQMGELQSHVERLLAPIDRKFPRLQDPFLAIFEATDGRRWVARGLDLGIHGCAVALPEPLEPGLFIRGSLAMDETIDRYPFEGRVIYCVPFATSFRVGFNITVLSPADRSYHQYLSARFLAQLRGRWEQQLLGT